MICTIICRRDCADDVVGYCVQVHMLTKYLVKGEYQEEREVPDPFHGGPEGFEKVGVAIHNRMHCLLRSLLD